MAEDGIPEILAEHRLGHEVPGMRGVYAHVTPAMRADLRDGLQSLWEAALQARAELSPRSAVAVLDNLIPDR